ncbi:UPF0149 family protein [Erwinia tracheiphila]|uniref:YecA family protein n=1 Tax=Erwinia tracheiphila TaxID=65700 RepID=A0A345CV94_9GAMM|nr:UPF0149 family protein [Erwinia tracheiphila]AXF77361.1 YecA family protein [Erwinia tracheiphila]EOS95084.1 hypothetical protein ETR_10172 [Erwinia tracheiphila PSU-1]UIA83951.1 UPF0149 family protein [Erwinia tracheiphila]UIA87557.1 UPF0149 family protein [Erwinia tracheiphila]UIA92533.1 UPF0149 family protein [Erwinia tracheiphila]
MSSGPLNEEELEWLDEILLNYGKDEAVLDMSELDGMLTAILSGPNQLSRSLWFAAIWGGEDCLPLWPSEETSARFTELVLRHMEDINERLNFAPEQFEPMFGLREIDGQSFTVVEEWCFGYLRGSALDDWSALSATLQPVFDVIALHGKEENFSQLDDMTQAQWEESQAAIAPAALELRQFWRTKRHSGLH